MTCEMLWRVGCDFLGNRKLLQHRTSPVGGAPPGSLGLGVVWGGTGHRPYRVQRGTSQGPRSATPLRYLFPAFCPPWPDISLLHLGSQESYG